MDARRRGLFCSVDARNQHHPRPGLPIRKDQYVSYRIQNCSDNLGMVRAQRSSDEVDDRGKSSAYRSQRLGPSVRFPQALR